MNANGSEPPRHVMRLAESLSECADENQAYDIDNALYSREQIIGVPVTVTSARPRQSDFWSDAKFAQVGFTFPDGKSGQINIGGQAGDRALWWQRKGKLPVAVTLQCIETNRSRQVWKWVKTHA